MSTNDPATVAPEPEGNDDLADFYSGNPDASERLDLDDESHQIGARLAEARLAVGLSPDELAQRIGVKESTISKWESGSTTPRGHLLARIAGLLGVSLSWLIIGRGVEPTERDQEIERLQASLRLARGRLSEVLTELDQIESRMSDLAI